MRMIQWGIVLLALGAAITTAPVTSTAHADEHSDKAISVSCDVSAGSGTDVRKFAARLEKKWDDAIKIVAKRIAEAEN